MKIVWTDRAVIHLNDIYTYIARDSPRYAQSMVDRIIRRASQIEIFPDSGQIVPEYEHAEIREVMAGVYRVIYRNSESRVEILAVVHGARLLPRDPA